MRKLVKEELECIQTELAYRTDALEWWLNNSFSKFNESEKALIKSAIKHLDRAIAEIETLLTKETENVNK